MYCKFSKQFHHLLETNLQLEHFEILDREEKLWATKFRTKWIRDVNRNTKFYRISTLVKRKINKIFVINDSVGNWIFLWGPHSGGISKLFSNIFSAAKVTSSLLVDYPDTWRTCLTNNQVCCLNNYVTWDEISKVTWNLKFLKLRTLMAFIWFLLEVVKMLSVNCFKKEIILNSWNNTFTFLILSVVTRSLFLNSYRPVYVVLFTRWSKKSLWTKLDQS